MVEQIENRERSSRTGDPLDLPANLPYRVELWQEADGAAVERVLARALNAPLARVVFRAAQREHPGRRIILRHGVRVLADSAQ